MTTKRTTRPVSRRAFLQTGAMAGAGGLVLALRTDPGAWSLGQPQLLAGPASTFTATLIRRADQLALRFEFFNLKLLKAGQPGPGVVTSARLVREISSQAAHIVVHFGPQTLAEFAMFDNDQPSLPLTTPVSAVVAGDSRLAFTVPESTTVIPYTVEDLLAWEKLTQNVVATARKTVAGTPVPVEPDATQTSIEAPWRLALSPHDQAAWAHVTTPDPPGPGGRTELWHTRLAVRSGEEIDELNSVDRTVRAVWTPGFVRSSPALVPPPSPPGDTSLSPLQRWEIVRLTSDWGIVSRRKPYVPLPMSVNQLALSSLGAWLKADGAWPDVHDDDIDWNFGVLSWSHRAATGRDHYVRVVERGFLFPIRHRAAIFKVYERKIRPVNDPTNPQHGRPGAFALKHAFILARDLERTYPSPVPGGAGAGKHPFGTRNMPFKKLRLTTTVTPNLVLYYGQTAVQETKVLKDLANPNGQFFGDAAFWPRVATGPNTSEDVLFSVIATDAEGRETNLSMPLIFVAVNTSTSQSDVDTIIDNYMSTDPTATARRTRGLSGQRVALATFPGGATGECAYPLEELEFGASLPDPPGGQLDPFNEPRFYPQMARARAHLDAVERVSGGSLGAQDLTLHDAWLTGAANEGRVFAKLTNEVALSFGADTSGGVVTPNMKITGLSADTGPIGGNLDQSAPIEFDPADFFAGAAPEILGGISLLDVIDNAGFGSAGGAPRLVSTPVPDGTETALTWRPKVKEALGLFTPSSEDCMTIVARSLVRADGSPPTTQISGDINEFKVHAVGSVSLATVDFRRLRFSSVDGSKPNVDADVRGVQFHGVLEFVNKLQNYLSAFSGSGQNSPAAKSLANSPASEPDGSGGAGFVEVTTAGIKVGYMVTLPTIAVGVFSLENIGLGTSLAIPFDGQPARIRFTFAERERPFLLTVSLFGGGGFCGVSFGLDQFELFEAALEFGAKLALDIGVASGGVSAMAGIYLAIGANEGELTGYLRLNGELDIMGIISMAIEFYLGFTYDMVNKEVWGEASVTVEIDVLVFSGSVTLGPVKRRFAGGGGNDPNLAAGNQAGFGGKAGSANKAIRALRRVAAQPAALNGSSPSFFDLIPPLVWSDYCGLYAPAAFA